MESVCIEQGFQMIDRYTIDILDKSNNRNIKNGKVRYKVNDIEIEHSLAGNIVNMLCCLYVVHLHILYLYWLFDFLSAPCCEGVIL